MKRIIYLILLLPVFLFSQEVPAPQPNTFVNDFANKLSVQQKEDLNKKILLLQDKSSIQFSIILVNDLPSETTIEEYARAIGNKWRVGYAQNGLVYVAAINQRKQRLEVGKRLEGTITDYTAVQIMDVTKPFFRQGDYYNGLIGLINNVQDKTDPARIEQLRLSEKAQNQKDEKNAKIFISALLWCVGIAGGVGLIAYLWMLPGIRRRKKQQKEDAEIQRQRNQELMEKRQRRLIDTLPRREFPSSYKRDSTSTGYIATMPSTNSDNHTLTSYPSRKTDSDSNYGKWGGTSDSGGSYDSGSSFSGGGGTSDW